MLLCWWADSSQERQDGSTVLTVIDDSNFSQKLIRYYKEKYPCCSGQMKSHPLTKGLMVHCHEKYLGQQCGEWRYFGSMCPRCGQ